jgi:hypothetical protein
MSLLGTFHIQTTTDKNRFYLFKVFLKDEIINKEEIYAIRSDIAYNIYNLVL